MDKKKLAVAVVAIAAGAGTAIALAHMGSNTSTPPSQTPTGLVLSSSSTSIAAGNVVVFNALLTDQAGKPISNYAVSLMGDGTLSATTDSTGTATWKLTFSASGTYNIFAQATPAQSNAISISVLAAPPTLAAMISASAATLYADQSVTITVSASGGMPNYYYTFYANGSIMPTSSPTNQSNMLSYSFDGFIGVTAFYATVKDSAGNTIQTTTVSVKTTQPMRSVNGYTYGPDTCGNWPANVTTQALVNGIVVPYDAVVGCAIGIYEGFSSPAWYYLAAHPGVGMFWCNTATEMQAVSTWFMLP